VFKREKNYEFLIEALKVWVLDTNLPCTVVTKITKSGKLVLGLDEDVVITYWVKEGNRYQRKYSTGDSQDVTPSPNPLLPLVSPSRESPQGGTVNQGVKGAKRKLV